jgi:hypothetical protein
MVLQHFLGKEKAGGSSPPVGSNSRASRYGSQSAPVVGAAFPDFTLGLSPAGNRTRRTRRKVMHVERLGQ